MNHSKSIVSIMPHWCNLKYFMLLIILIFLSCSRKMAYLKEDVALSESKLEKLNKENDELNDSIKALIDKTDEMMKEFVHLEFELRDSVAAVIDSIQEYYSNNIKEVSSKEINAQPKPVKSNSSKSKGQNNKTDTLTVQPDSNSLFPSNGLCEGNKLGTLGYYCPRKTLEDQAFNISVMISIVNDTAFVTQKIKDELSEAEEIVEQKIPDADKYIKAHQIKISDFMKVECILDTSKFTFMSSPDSSVIKIDSTTEWHWTIKPRLTGTHSISFKVSRLCENGNTWRIIGHPKIFKVDVEIDPRSWLAKFWELCKEDPKYPIGTLIIPFISYFAGLLQGKRNEKNKTA